MIRARPAAWGQNLPHQDTGHQTACAFLGANRQGWISNFAALQPDSRTNARSWLIIGRRVTLDFNPPPLKVDPKAKSGNTPKLRLGLLKISGHVRQRTSMSGPCVFNHSAADEGGNWHRNFHLDELPLRDDFDGCNVRGQQIRLFADRLC